MDPELIRQVVLHSPGPSWRAGVGFREQPGVADHVAHYAALLAAGRLEMGGPFLAEDSGGMMVATPDVTADELATFAADDPAVVSGLLTFEVRAWYTAMRLDG